MENIRVFFNNIGSLIGMDTKDKNESNKVVVILRIMIIAFVLQLMIKVAIYNMIFKSANILILYGVFFLLYIGIFIMSYYQGTKATLWCFNICTIILIYSIIYFLGFSTGVQYYLSLLLILNYFSDHKNYKGKAVFSILLCAFHIWLLYSYDGKVSVWQLTEMEKKSIQSLNIITIFFSISVISYLFSRHSQNLEGKLIEYNNQLEQAANTDTLTGLYNRRKTMEYLEELTKKSGANQGFSICICDIDFFKKVNDNYGHDLGDEVLKSISHIFKEEMTGKNLAARWGGEEFLLIFPEANGDEAYVRLKHIRERVKQMRVVKGELSIGVTMTFGLSEYDYVNGLEATLKDADNKLYMGKEGGRDVIIF